MLALVLYLVSAPNALKSICMWLGDEDFVDPDDIEASPPPEAWRVGGSNCPNAQQLARGTPAWDTGC